METNVTSMLGDLTATMTIIEATEITITIIKTLQKAIIKHVTNQANISLNNRLFVWALALVPIANITLQLLLS